MLLEAPSAETLKGKRDRAILATLLYHGLRREEVCKLRVRDLQQREGVLHFRVHGKGDKVRYIPVGLKAQRLITEYLDEAKHKEDLDGALFRPVKNNWTKTLSEFFSRLRLEAHVGCSPSALRTVMHLLERLLLDTAAIWEKEGIAYGEIRPVIGAVDETFLQRMMLVFMDLATGYLLMEEVATDRSFDTWFDRTNDRLKTFGTEVLYLVSDRAKALIKLAHTGLGCPSIPDLFHLGRDLAKGYSLAIFGRLRHAKRDLEQAKQRLETLQKNAQAEHAQVVQGQAQVAACATSVTHWQGVGRAWRQHLSNVSRILHPWRLLDSTRQTSQEVEEQLRAELEAIETLLETNGLPRKKATLDKVRKQLAGLAALVDLWWQTVHQDLTQMAMPPRWTQWTDELLLPLMYWHEQLRRTRCPGHKAQIALVLQAVEEALEQHPCTRKLTAERCWRAGKRGLLSTRGRSSGPLRQLKVETAISRRCSTTIAACPRVATRCGRRCITSIVGPRMGRHRRRGFSGDRFPICLRAYLTFPLCCFNQLSCCFPKRTA
jgi:hypothetical protein